MSSHQIPHKRHYWKNGKRDKTFSAGKSKFRLNKYINLVKKEKEILKEDRSRERLEEIGNKIYNQHLLLAEAILDENLRGGEKQYKILEELGNRDFEFALLHSNSLILHEGFYEGIYADIEYERIIDKCENLIKILKLRYNLV